MSDEFRDRIAPVGARQPIDRLDSHGELSTPPRPNITVSGTVTAVHQSAPQHAGESHVLDVTVGAESFTELVVRVPRGAYKNWEGKNAILYLDE